MRSTRDQTGELDHRFLVPYTHGLGAEGTMRHMDVRIRSRVKKQRLWEAGLTAAKEQSDPGLPQACLNNSVG